MAIPAEGFAASIFQQPNILGQVAELEMKQQAMNAKQAPKPQEFKFTESFSYSPDVPSIGAGDLIANRIENDYQSILSPEELVTFNLAKQGTVDPNLVVRASSTEQKMKKAEKRVDEFSKQVRASLETIQKYSNINFDPKFSNDYNKSLLLKASLGTELLQNPEYAEFDKENVRWVMKMNDQKFANIISSLYDDPVVRDKIIDEYQDASDDEKNYIISAYIGDVELDSKGNKIVPFEGRGLLPSETMFSANIEDMPSEINKIAESVAVLARGTETADGRYSKDVVKTIDDKNKRVASKTLFNMKNSPTPFAFQYANYKGIPITQRDELEKAFLEDMQDRQNIKVSENFSPKSEGSKRVPVPYELGGGKPIKTFGNTSQPMFKLNPVGDILELTSSTPMSGKAILIDEDTVKTNPGEQTILGLMKGEDGEVYAKIDNNILTTTGLIDLANLGPSLQGKVRTMGWIKITGADRGLIGERLYTVSLQAANRAFKGDVSNVEGLINLIDKAHSIYNKKQTIPEQE